MSERTNGAVLVARKDSEYYFIDSVFKHDDGLAGCTGSVVYPLTEGMVDDMLSTDSLVERYGDYWEETHKNSVDENCEACDGHLDDDGCSDCGYPSVENYCNSIGNCEGVDAVIEDMGSEYTEALNLVCDSEVDYADCIGCGRIFGRYGSDKPMTPGYFHGVYNMKALVACLAYEAGAVDYDYAVKVIFG